MKEIWKPLRKFEEYLFISNLGNVKSLSRYVSNGKGERIIPERIIPPRVSNDKYKYAIIQFKIENKHHHIMIARAVYETFNNIDLDNKKVVVHKDGNRLNNKLENIKIITRRAIKQIRANKTGAVGVTKHKEYYTASICFEGKRLSLHTSTIKEECHKIYQLAKAMIDEYDKLKSGILSNSRLNNKLIEKEIDLLL
jgi:hypothetical protein